MSDYDRGAYTPPTEESFAFDARTPEVRRPVPVTLVGTLVVLVVLVSAVALFYWSGVRGKGEAPRVVGKPQLQIKTPPPADAKPIADDGKLDVYDEEKGQAPAGSPPKTAFAAPPEQPQPRPAAPAAARAQAQTQAPASTQLLSPAQPAPAPAQAAPAAAKPAPAPAASSPAAQPASPPKPVAAVHPNDAVSNLLARNEALAAAAAAKAKAKAQVQAKPEAAPAGAAHGVMVQIGAFSSAEIADTQFARTKAAFASYTAGKAKHVERAQVGGKVYWRTAFAGFDRERAKAFCRALIAAKKGCIIR